MRRHARVSLHHRCKPVTLTYSTLLIAINAPAGKYGFSPIPEVLSVGKTEFLIQHYCILWPVAQNGIHWTSCFQNHVEVLLQFGSLLFRFYRYVYDVPSAWHLSHLSSMPPIPQLFMPCCLMGQTCFLLMKPF